MYTLTFKFGFFFLSLLFFFESISLDFVCSSHHRLPGLHQWFFPLLHGVFPDFCEFCQRRWPLRKVPTPDQLWIFSSAGDLQEIQHPVSAARRAQQHHAGRRPLCCQWYGRLLRGQNVHHQLSGWEVLFGFSPSLSLRVCVWGWVTDLWCVLGFRRRTPSPSWPLLSSATLRFSPSTLSSESKFTIPLRTCFYLMDKNVWPLIDGRQISSVYFNGWCVQGGVYNTHISHTTNPHVNVLTSLFSASQFPRISHIYPQFFFFALLFFFFFFFSSTNIKNDATLKANNLFLGGMNPRTHPLHEFICFETRPLLAFPPVPPRSACRRWPTSPSWPCSSCTCWRLFLATSPFTVTPRVPVRWMEDFCLLMREGLCFRRCGVGAAAHLQPGGPPGRAGALRAAGCAGGRHPHRSCGSFPCKQFACWSGVRDIIGFSFHLNLVILMTLWRTKVPSDLRSDQKKCPCLNGHWMTLNVGLATGLVSFVPWGGTCSGASGMAAPLGAASPRL